MKKITYLIIAISLIINSASALEKKDCSGLKKLSKAFIACKSGNLKAGIVNTGSAIKKGTVVLDAIVQNYFKESFFRSFYR